MSQPLAPPSAIHYRTLASFNTRLGKRDLSATLKTTEVSSHAVYLRELFFTQGEAGARTCDEFTFANEEPARSEKRDLSNRYAQSR